MDAKEKKDRADQTARRVYDILKNHDQEMSTIEAQIDAERAALEEDLEAIRARAYPRGVECSVCPVYGDQTPGTSGYSDTEERWRKCQGF